VSRTLLDTSTIAPRERDNAAREFFGTLAEFDVVEHACQPESIRTRVSAWDLRSFQLTVTESPWLRVARTDRRVATEAVSIAAQVSGRTTVDCGGRVQTCAPGDIRLIDLGRSFELRSGDPCTSMSVRLTYAELCLPASVIQSAVGALATSALYELFQTHLLQLCRLLDEAVRPSAAESLGATTLELARAVIATAGQDDLSRSVVANEALLTRIEAYVQQHLADPALSPASIARAHQISVRQLYKLWSAKDRSLTEWIMQGRLEGARRTIANDESAGLAAVARQWGFTNPAHFARRFRSAYGLSPQEWKRVRHGRPRSRRRQPASFGQAEGELRP
jgi:AraC-like DNA-binding protein